MKIKSGFMTRTLGDKIVAVAVGQRAFEFNGMINLNASGKFIWDCLAKDTDIDEIVAKMVKEYDIDHDTAMDAATKFIDILRENDILDE